MGGRSRVASFRQHRSWCRLFWRELPAYSPVCDCGELDVVDLVEWWASQARDSAEAVAA